MFEFHGWCTIRYSTHGTDEKKQNQVLDNIYAWLETKYGVYLAEKIILLNRYNGNDCISINGQHNHYQEWPEKVFENVGKIAIGSYGLLYTLNIDSDENAFKVYRLSRSKVSQFDDKFLSPYIPTVEDEFDWNKED